MQPAFESLHSGMCSGASVNTVEGTVKSKSEVYCVRQGTANLCTPMPTTLQSRALTLQKPAVFCQDAGSLGRSALVGSGGNQAASSTLLFPIACAFIRHKRSLVTQQ